MALESFIRREAGRLGFAAAGIAAVGPCQTFPIFAAWLEHGHAAGMDFLRRHTELRSDPRLVAPAAKSVIVVAARYPTEARIRPFSNYTRGRDYHDVLRSKLKQLAHAIETEAKQPIHGRICVDSAPVLEREWAVRAGLGWIGRQGSLVSPEWGCTLFLGELLVDLELIPSQSQGGVDAVRQNRGLPFYRTAATPEALHPIRLRRIPPVTEGCPNFNRCGACRKCVAACPTDAIQPDGRVDARRCISYLTIEHQGEIPEALRPRMGQSLFGCDRCTAVCPFNPTGTEAVMPEFSCLGRSASGGNPADAGLPTSEQCIAMSAADFERRFRGTAVYRSGLARLKRNAQIALANQNLSKP